MKLYLVLFCFLYFIKSQAFAGSIAGTGGSTEVTQILNNVQLVEQANELMKQSAQLRDQIARQTAMVSDMNKQGKKMSRHEWGTTSSDLSELAAVARQGEGLAYSAANLDVLFRQKYKGYDAYSKEQNESTSTYSDQYGDWSKSNMDAISGAMKAANLQQSQFSSEEQTMQSLQRMGETADGRMQALEVGQQLAAQQVRQTQKLRALLMAQMQMQASYMASEVNEKDAYKAKSEKYFKGEATDINVKDGHKF